MSHKRFLVTVDPDSDPEAVAADLMSHGFQVDNVMKEIGIISATTDANDVSSVRSLQGVSAIEEDQEVKIPPPDSPVQ